MGVWWASLLGIQNLDDMSDLHQAVLGQQHFTDPKHSNFWYRIEEVLNKGLLNEDAASIGFAEGNDKFIGGKVGMVFAVQSMVNGYIKEMGADTVSVMISPTPPNPGKLAGRMPFYTMPLGIAKLSKHPAVAADFYGICTRMDRAAWGQRRHPASNKVSPAAMSAADKLMAGGLWKCPLYIQRALHRRSKAKSGGGPVDSTGSDHAQQAARMYEEAAEKWRREFRRPWPGSRGSPTSGKRFGKIRIVRSGAYLAFPAGGGESLRVRRGRAKCDFSQKSALAIFHSPFSRMLCSACVLVIAFVYLYPR
jgi:hypothetical protein